MHSQSESVQSYDIVPHFVTYETTLRSLLMYISHLSNICSMYSRCTCIYGTYDYLVRIYRWEIFAMYYIATNGAFLLGVNGHLMLAGWLLPETCCCFVSHSLTELQHTYIPVSYPSIHLVSAIDCWQKL